MSQKNNPSDTKKSPRPLASLLLTQPQAWRYCGMSRTTWFNCKRIGPAPALTRLPTGGIRYHRDDLDSWMARLAIY